MDFDTIPSPLPYNYITIKVTQSRINKGLLAIPVALVDRFPEKKTNIQILFDDNKQFVQRNYTPYGSSSRECRIGGMKQFFEINKIKNGDEIVIQFID